MVTSTPFVASSLAKTTGCRYGSTITDDVNAVAVGALPDGTPVIVSGGDDYAVRVWRLADGTPVGEPLHGHIGVVEAVAVGAISAAAPTVSASTSKPVFE